MNREQGVSKSAEKTKKSGKLPRLKSPQIFSYASPRNHLIFQAKLLVCPCKWANKTVLHGRG